VFNLDGFADFLWLFFILWVFLTFITPQMRYSALRRARANIIRGLEVMYNSKVITLIHRQERISLFGIPIYKFIDIEDSEEVLRAIRSTPPDKGIMLIMHTPGGLMLAASQIALALKRHPGKKIVVVPHYAMSGGTLIALAADEIWMDPDAVLGPVDPQIGTQSGTLPAPSIVKVVREKGVDKVDDDTLILADIAEKALNQTKDLVKKLLEGKLSQDKMELVIDRLVMGRYTHDWPITAEELKELGLNVKTEIPPAIYSLMSLYPQEAARRPAVEYLPTIPHKSETLMK
jgi:ClpP class serine protease